MRIIQIYHALTDTVSLFAHRISQSYIIVSFSHTPSYQSLIYFWLCAVFSCTLPAFCKHVRAKKRSIIKRQHSDCQNLQINAAVCWFLKIINVASLRRFYFNVSQISGTQDLRFLTLRRLMSYIYIYGAPILDVSRSHTTTQHIR